MPLNIGHFIAKPLFFKDKQIDIISYMNLKKCFIDEENKFTIVEFIHKSQTSNSIYNITIQLFTIDSISSSTPIKVYCSCKSFLFHHQSLLHKYDSAYGEVKDTRLPNKPNKVFVCKHIYPILTFLMKHNNVNNIKHQI